MVVGSQDFNHNFYIHGQRLKILNEEEDWKGSIKYLGFHITPDGDWSKFLKYLLQKAGKELSDGFHAYSNQLIPFGTRIRVAKSRCLSQLSYGQDIVPLDAHTEAKFRSFQAKVLRVIFGVPKATSADALLMIAGEAPICENRAVFAAINLQRMRKFPTRTFSLLMRGSTEFRSHSSTCSLLLSSEAFIRGALVHSTLTHQGLDEEYRKFRDSQRPEARQRLKDILKGVVFNNAYCTALRALMNREGSSSTDFPLCFSRPKHLPLLNARGYQFSHYTVLQKFSENFLNSMLNWS